VLALDVTLNLAPDLEPPSPRRDGKNRTMSYGNAPKEQLAGELASLVCAMPSTAQASQRHATIVYCEEGNAGYA